MIDNLTISDFLIQQKIENQIFSQNPIRLLGSFIFSWKVISLNKKRQKVLINFPKWTNIDHSILSVLLSGKLFACIAVWLMNLNAGFESNYHI